MSLVIEEAFGKEGLEDTDFKKLGEYFLGSSRHRPWV
jgi:hypothetical protein